MGSISFGDTSPWVVAGFAFRRFLTTARNQVGDDPALTYEIDRAMALDGLHLELVVDDGARSRLVDALLVSAQEVGNEADRPPSVESRADDEEMYRKSVEELVSKLQSAQMHRDARDGDTDAGVRPQT